MQDLLQAFEEQLDLPTRLGEPQDLLIGPDPLGTVLISKIQPARNSVSSSRTRCFFLAFLTLAARARTASSGFKERAIRRA
jgi:hypothetical protein